MSGIAQTLKYADHGKQFLSFQRISTSTLALDEIVARIRARIEATGLWILHEIDPQKLMKQSGYIIREARQILFFHPDFMARLLAAEPAALLEAPLKFAVLERDDGTVVIHWLDPISAFSRYDNIDLTELAKELAGICETIITEALFQKPA
jgi:uncharacterized protein (DUF302 family)